MIYIYIIYTGKLADDLFPGMPADYVKFPDGAKVQDLSAASFYMMALSVSGDVYYWGKRQVSQLACGLSSRQLQKCVIIITVLVMQYNNKQAIQ